MTAMHRIKLWLERPQYLGLKLYLLDLFWRSQAGSVRFMNFDRLYPVGKNITQDSHYAMDRVQYLLMRRDSWGAYEWHGRVVASATDKQHVFIERTTCPEIAAAIQDLHRRIARQKEGK